MTVTLTLLYCRTGTLICNCVIHNKLWEWKLGLCVCFTITDIHKIEPYIHASLWNWVYSSVLLQWESTVIYVYIIYKLWPMISWWWSPAFIYYSVWKILISKNYRTTFSSTFSPLQKGEWGLYCDLNKLFFSCFVSATLYMRVVEQLNKEEEVVHHWNNA